jgi:histidinol dehydrogenase
MDLLDASPQPHAPPAHQARLDALRKAAQRIDPVRLHYLDVLSQRIATAPEAVQRVLENTLDTALTELEQRLEKPQPAANATKRPIPPRRWPR